jgi:hypothetical protein
MLLEVEDLSAFVEMGMKWSDVMSKEATPVMRAQDIAKLRTRSK